MKKIFIIAIIVSVIGATAQAQEVLSYQHNYPCKIGISFTKDGSTTFPFYNSLGQVISSGNITTPAANITADQKYVYYYLWGKDKAPEYLKAPIFNGVVKIVGRGNKCVIPDVVVTIHNQTGKNDFWFEKNPTLFGKKASDDSLFQTVAMTKEKFFTVSFRIVNAEGRTADFQSKPISREDPHVYLTYDDIKAAYDNRPSAGVSIVNVTGQNQITVKIPGKTDMVILNGTSGWVTLPKGNYTAQVQHETQDPKDKRNPKGRVITNYIHFTVDDFINKVTIGTGSLYGPEYLVYN
ncbi:MAG: hypothetical protein MUF50_02485 [Planctomycetes bacterium]|jgi:hypothetical protein|nr:hypothetical protein [Planctomycetota bacterium]